MTSDESQKDSVIEALLHEYDQLTAYTTQIWMASFRILPVFFTLGAAILVYAGKPFIIIGIPYAIFFFGIWLGFIHAMDSGAGLYVVRLEQKINRRLGVPNSEGLEFVSRFLGNPGRLPGFERYFIILALFVVMILILSFIGLWELMDSGGWGVRSRIAAIIFPLALNFSVLLVIDNAEKKTKRRRRRLIQKYQKGQQRPT